MYFKIKLSFCLCVLSAFLLFGVAFAEIGTTDAKVINKKAVNNAADKSKAKMPPDPLGTHKATPVEKPKTTSNRDKVSAAGYYGSDDGTTEPIQERPNPMDSKSRPPANKR